MRNLIFLIVEFLCIAIEKKIISFILQKKEEINRKDRDRGIAKRKENKGISALLMKKIAALGNKISPFLERNITIMKGILSRLLRGDIVDRLVAILIGMVMDIIMLGVGLEGMDIKEGCRKGEVNSIINI